MKRLLLACLLLTATVAEARQVSHTLAVIKLDSHEAGGASSGPYDVEVGNFVHEEVLAVLNEWGVDYITINAGSVPTGKMEWYRTGVFAIGPDTITVRAVLHERTSRRAATMDFPQYRPDSILAMIRVVNSVTRVPAIPQLGLLDATGSYTDASSVLWTTSVSCSLGLGAGGDLSVLYGGSGIPHECEACWYGAEAQAGNSFFSTNSGLAGALNFSTTGGILPLVGVYTNHVSGRLQTLGDMALDLMYAPDVTDDDTTGTYGFAPGPRPAASPDSAGVWKKLYIGFNTTDADGDTVPAAQAILSTTTMIVGDGSTLSSRSEFSHDRLMLGLAALDSLLDGDLLLATGTMREPKVVALTIDGAFARCEQQYSMGVYLPDSAAVKATVDSIVARGIPFVVGANVDSVADYPYERAWWSKGRAKFSPQVWSGVQGANGEAGYDAGRYALNDLFGHQRARTAYGPAWPDTSDDVSADTSAYALMRYAFMRCDSLFPGRTSRFLLPPLDDVIPTNTAKADSMWIAARLAGASGIRICGLDTVRTGYQKFIKQQWHLGLKALAHTGEYVTGGSRIMGNAGNEDVPNSYFVSDSGYVYHTFCQIQARMWTGLIRGGGNEYVSPILRGDGVESSASGQSTGFEAFASATQPFGTFGGDSAMYDANRYHNGFGMGSRGSIIKVAASTLGGSTQDLGIHQPTGEALRPGWWVIRSTDGFIKTLNAIAGRTLVRWGYPDQVEP